MPPFLTWVGAFVLGVIAASAWTVFEESNDLFHLGGGAVRLIAYAVVIAVTACVGIVMTRRRRTDG